MEPIVVLRHNREVASLEAMSLSGIANAITNIIPDTAKNVQGLFDKVQNFITSQLIVRFSGDRSAFLFNLSKNNFMNLSPLEIYIPEGLNVHYVDYLGRLGAAVEFLEMLPVELEAYEQLLAGFTANKDSLRSTDYVESKFKSIEQGIVDTETGLRSCFTNGSVKTTAKVREVVKNNSEWAAVLDQLENVQKRLDAIDREELFKAIKRCSAILDIIERQAKAGHLTDMSGDMVRKFSDYTFIVAKYLELYSIIYHMVNTVAIAINESVKKINDISKA